MVMTNVPSSKLKAKMGIYLRAVRAGKELVITDRDVPIARVVPHEAGGAREERLVVQPRDPDAPPLGKVQVRGIRYKGPNSTELLKQDRRR